MKPTMVRGKYQVGCVYDRKRYRRSSGTANLKAAERLQAQIDLRIEQLNTGLVQIPEDVPLREYLLYGSAETEKDVARIDISTVLDRYMRSLSPPRTSEAYMKTLRFYEGHFRRFLQDKGAALPDDPGEWKAEHLEEYRSWRLSKKGVSRSKSVPRPCTVAKEIGFLGRMFTFARKRGWVEHVPTLDLDPIPDTKPDVPYRTLKEAEAVLESEDLTDEERRLVIRHRILDLDEIDSLLTHLRSCSLQHFVRTPGDVALVMHIAAETGFRFGEIMRLRQSDIDLDGAVLTARSRKQSRSRTETRRQCPIGPSLVETIADWMSRREDVLLIADDATGPSFRRRFYAVLEKSTSGTAFHGVTPHMLRHSLRSNLTMEGVDERSIDAVLGHTTVEVARMYRHITAAGLKKALGISETEDPDGNRPDDDRSVGFRLMSG